MLIVRFYRIFCILVNLNGEITKRSYSLYASLPFVGQTFVSGGGMDTFLTYFSYNKILRRDCLEANT